jgi:hypothetical protein
MDFLFLSNGKGEPVTRAKKVKLVNYANGKGRHLCRPLPDKQRLAASGNLVEITQLDPGQEMAPLLGAELADEALWIIGVTNKYRFTATCHSYACAALTRARNEPGELTLS